MSRKFTRMSSTCTSSRKSHYLHLVAAQSSLICGCAIHMSYVIAWCAWRISSTYVVRTILGLAELVDAVWDTTVET
jgi:hypothetical protein